MGSPGRQQQTEQHRSIIGLCVRFCSTQPGRMQRDSRPLYRNTFRDKSPKISSALVLRTTFEACTKVTQSAGTRRRGRVTVCAPCHRGPERVFEGQPGWCLVVRCRVGGCTCRSTRRRRGGGWVSLQPCVAMPRVCGRTASRSWLRSQSRTFASVGRVGIAGPTPRRNRVHDGHVCPSGGARDSAIGRRAVHRISRVSAFVLPAVDVVGAVA